MLQHIDATLAKSAGGCRGTAVEDLTDEAVVDRAKAGDHASFELIMRRYNQRLFRVARSIVGSDVEAEDVVQETYVRAYGKLAQFEGRARFSTWLTRIAVYEASARRRRLRRMRLLDPSELENASMTTNLSANEAVNESTTSELGEILARAVDELPTKLRTVFVARMVEGLDTDETAACLKLTPSNVKTRLHRARSLLRRQIDKQIGSSVRRLYQFGGDRCDRIVERVLSRLESVQQRPVSAQPNQSAADFGERD